MKCSNCAKHGLESELNESTTEYFASRDGHYFIIEDTPCLQCGACGETFFKLSTLERIERYMSKAGGTNEKVILAAYHEGPEAA